jgi:hypothetical protein
MNYDNLQAELSAEIEWRIKELTAIKTLQIKKVLNKNEKEVVRKFAIPNIYATWEGFVKTAFRIYINKLNNLNLTHNELHNTVVTHSFDVKYSQFTTGIKNEFAKKCDFISKFISDLNKPIAIETKLPTESNINWKVLNKLLERFNLVLFPATPYKTMLDDLLFIRNSVAHGECSIPIAQDLIDTHVANITTMMDDVMFKILAGCKELTYRN